MGVPLAVSQHCDNDVLQRSQSAEKRTCVLVWLREQTADVFLNTIHVFIPWWNCVMFCMHWPKCYTSFRQSAPKNAVNYPVICSNFKPYASIQVTAVIICSALRVVTSHYKHVSRNTLKLTSKTRKGSALSEFLPPYQLPTHFVFSKPRNSVIMPRHRQRLSLRTPLAAARTDPPSHLSANCMSTVLETSLNNLGRNQTISADGLSMMWALVMHLIQDVPFIVFLSAAGVTACRGGWRLSAQ